MLKVAPDRLKKIIICRVVIPFYKIWSGHELYINFHKFRENAAFTHFICFGRFYELIKEHEQGRKSGGSGREGNTYASERMHKAIMWLKSESK